MRGTTHSRRSSPSTPEDFVVDSAAMEGVDAARLRPPRPSRFLLTGALERRASVLATAPVVYLHGGAGYGKTTAADALTRDHDRLWYSLTSADADPQTLMAHLRRASASSTSESFDSWIQDVDSWLEAIESRTGELVVVFDDHHAVAATASAHVIARIIERQPHSMRLVVTSRQPLEVGAWPSSVAAGHIHTVPMSDLQFDVDDVVRLFDRSFGIPLDPEPAALLTEETEGWPVALALFGRHMVDRHLDVETMLGELPDTRSEIFAYLSDRVISAMPDHVQEFIADCACLETWDPAACAEVTGLTIPEVEMVLSAVSGYGLLCIDLGAQQHRLHHLVRDQLMAIAPPPRLRAAHGRAARYYRRIEQYESAARHSLAAGDHPSAARDLEQLAPALLESGRHRILTALLPSIDASEVDSRPGLLLAYSRALRLLSRFDESSQVARRARRAFADQGDMPGEFDACAAEAMVYLDTVQPEQAARLVDEAEALAVRCGGTRLLAWRSLVLENLVNSGDLSAAAAALDSRHPDEHPLDRAATRLSIRRGELPAALARIRPRARSTEPGRRHPPAAHREDSAMLSWVHGMLGDRIPAASIAREGCDVGRRLESPIVEGVCTGRLGLALLCGESGNTAGEATEHFHRALEIAARIGVDRFRVEPLLGLTALAGVNGDVVRVREHGSEAVSAARRAGDRYAAGLASVTTGVALARCGHPTAEPVLLDGLAQVTATGDGYAALVASMWLAHGALPDARSAEFQEHAQAAIEWTVALELDDLWLADPWIGLPPREDRVRLLAAAESSAIGGDYPGYLRARLNAVGAGSVVDERAQGHAMRVTTLGGFHVTVGGRVIADGEWSRRKAKELLWLLVSRESRSVLREEAIEVLWPNQGADAALTRFRVSLHSLRNTLEPARATGEPSAFVRSRRDRVELTEHVDVDVQEFRSLTDAPPTLEAARRAIDLYQGDFIADEVEAEWLEPVRREARQSFVEACEFAAAEHLRRGEWAIAVKTARRAVALDAFRESPYRVQCEAHLAMGDRLAAIRVYDDLCRVLIDELGARPSWSLDDLEPTPVTLA